MGASELGYPEANAFERSSLIWTHVFLLPPMWLSWRVRNEVPWVLLSLTLCFLASNAYHLCYSYDVCLFEDRRIHRHADHYFSLMVVPVVLTRFLFVRRRVSAAEDAYVAAAALPAHAPQTPPVLSMPQLLDTDDCEAVTAARAPVQRLSFMKRAVATTEAAVVQSTGTAETIYERPVELDAFIYALYLLNSYMHISQGMQHYASYKTLMIGIAMVSGAHAYQILEHGLRIRVAVLAVVLIPAILAYGMFTKDEVFGAGGHSSWHTFGFESITALLYFGPIFVDGNGEYGEL